MKKMQKRISTAVIAVGALLLLAGGVYWFSGYPWALLLSRMGWHTLPEDLPDPAPLSADLLVTGADPARPDSPDLDALPGPGDWTAPRPAIQMVPLGVIKLPKLQVTENIVEGSGDELLYAVGHVRGTALPGQAGNCVLADHRNYIQMNPFRHLDKLEPGDPVLVKDGEFLYTYVAYKLAQVGPGDVWVMEDQEEEDHVLTLVTCTPVLNPTRRLVVWCRLTDREEL